MTPEQEAAALRRIADALGLIEDALGALQQHPSISDDTSDIVSRAGIDVSGISDKLTLRAEMLDPTPYRTIAQLDAGKMVPAIKEAKS